jgi:hypothetical protein
MTQTLDTPVLVAGAGPTGLVLASVLSGYGINCVLVERNTHTTRFPKMDVTNGASMELLRRLGADAELRSLNSSPIVSATDGDVLGGLERHRRGRPRVGRRTRARRPMTHSLKALTPQQMLMRNNHQLIAVDGHAALHSEHGANRGEHSGRSVNPTIKVTELAWLEFEKPDLDRAETFARAFGFAVAAREPKTLYLRGSLPGTPAVTIRQGARPRFIGPTFKAADAADLHALAWANNRRAEPLDEPAEGSVVRLCDPSGITVGVDHGRSDLPALPEQRVHTLNFGSDHRRINSTQRPPSEPAQVQRLGHLVMQTPHFLRSLNWHLDTLGLIVSDFQYVPGQRDRGPALTYIRCDRRTVPSDHHTVALNLGPQPATCIPPIRSPTWTRWPPAESTCYTKGTNASGAWAATFWAVRSSTTGTIPTR